MSISGGIVSGGILSGWDIVVLKCWCFAEIPRVGYGRVRYCRGKQKGNQLIALPLTLPVGYCRTGGGILSCGILSDYQSIDIHALLSIMIKHSISN